MPVGIVVQHHPSRAELLERLLPRLPGARVVVDPLADGQFRSAWHAYEACLRSRQPDETHLLVVQDDAWPCDGYVAALEAAVAARPDRVIVTCVCGNAKRNCRRMWQACEAGLPFAELDANEWCPTVATCYPAAVLDELLAWIDVQKWPPHQIADDAPIGRFLNETGMGALMTVPSLVEHPDDAVSLVAPHDTRWGEAAERTACCLIEEGCDATSIEWQ